MVSVIAIGVMVGLVFAVAVLVAARTAAAFITGIFHSLRGTRMFKLKRTNTFPRKIEVRFPDQTVGVLDASLVMLDAEKFAALETDQELAEAVLHSPGPVMMEGATEPLPEDQARAAVLGDMCCVSAIVGEYLQATKQENLFRGKPGRRR